MGKGFPEAPLPLEALGMDSSLGELALVVEIAPAHLRVRPLADEDVDALVAEVALEAMGVALLVRDMREEGSPDTEPATPLRRSFGGAGSRPLAPGGGRWGKGGVLGYTLQ